ncbi:MAG: hypothetical protein R2864_11320 [Syntrophotaleaceae bacterium]
MSDAIILGTAMETAVQEMIAKVRAGVDMDKVRALIAQQYGLEGIDSVDFAAGELLAKNDAPALRLDYTVLMNVPLYFDMQGNLLKDAESQVETEPAQQQGAEEEAVDRRFDYSGMQAGAVTRTF